MKEAKTYELKTLEEVIAVVNEDNFNVFMKDFRAWVALHMSIKKVQEMFPSVIRTEGNVFKWTDDGKTEMNINLKFRQPEDRVREE